jgi:hypothetical protein
MVILGTQMGKRSAFPRIDRDSYDTPPEAVRPLLRYLPPATRFAEPCAGGGALIRHLRDVGHACVFASDLMPRGEGIKTFDLRVLPTSRLNGAKMVITNPPWSRKVLHQMLVRLRQLGLPAWLLLDANWMFTRQAAPYLFYCERIVTIGRVKWIPGTTMTGKDDCAWFLFQPHPTPMTLFMGKTI